MKGKSRPTLSDPMDCSPPAFSIHGISRQEYWSGVPLPSPLGQQNTNSSVVLLIPPAVPSLPTGDIWNKFTGYIRGSLYCHCLICTRTTVTKIEELNFQPTNLGASARINGPFSKPHLCRKAFSADLPVCNQKRRLTSNMPKW